MEAATHELKENLELYQIISCLLKQQILFSLKGTVNKFNDLHKNGKSASFSA